MLRPMVVLACVLWFAAPVSAQCVFSTPPSQVWPTSVTFDPPQPVAGQPFVALLGPATSSFWQPPDVPVRNGALIDVSGYLANFDGTPPPAVPVRIQFGALPAGQYLVRFRMSGIGGACAPLDAPLVVVGAGPGASVPGPARGAIAWLIALVLAAGAYMQRRRART